jgi:DNA-binding response OmpR family regulator
MSRKRILLVDDSNTALMMEKMILKSYDVEVAKDGQEGLEKAIAAPPDLILLDLVMPRMDGLEACQRLRHHEATRAVPIIMVTTRSEESNVEAGFVNGCTEYVTKPINGPELLSKVRNLLGA